MIAEGRPLVPRNAPEDRPAFGETATVMVRADLKAAYPVVSGVPILLAPEVLSRPGETPQFDLTNPQYAEAYLEMPFYNEAASKIAETLQQTRRLSSVHSESLNHLDRLRQLPADARAGFPKPFKRWASARMDLTSQWDCFRHLAPVNGKCVLQLGGQGAGALMLLLAGATEAVLLTPMVGEALVAHAVAAILGVSAQLHCVVAVAEEIPMADASMDIVFSGGCVHHLRTEIAFSETARVLRRDGRFAAIEPWRAPLYTLGTRVFGKREANAFCRPLTPDRVAPLYTAFREARCIQHGTLTRYPMLALERFGVRIPTRVSWVLSRADDWFCGWIPGLRRWGSGVALLATK
jgi:ubiquinone/menaquinone biosynthesis C-methylase UbiE